MQREQQNEACFDFDVNEAFKMAQPFAFGHENYGARTFLFLLAPQNDHRPKGGNHFSRK